MFMCSPDSPAHILSYVSHHHCLLAQANRHTLHSQFISVFPPPTFSCWFQTPSPPARASKQTHRISYSHRSAPAATAATVVATTAATVTAAATGCPVVAAVDASNLAAVRLVAGGGGEGKDRGSGGGGEGGGGEAEGIAGRKWDKGLGLQGAYLQGPFAGVQSIIRALLRCV